MGLHVVHLVAVLCLAATSSYAFDLFPSCPPAGFSTVSAFNLTAYAAAPWYVQMQEPLLYQPASQLYCVRARYTLRNPKAPQEGVTVNNYANRDRVNGEPVGTSGSGGSTGTLVAVPDSRASGPTAASKLRVGPQFLQRLPARLWYPLFGPYWVVAVGPSKDKNIAYDWAIVIGGSPKLPGSNGCRPSIPGLYFGGLWFFSRKPVDPTNTAVMLATAAKMGLDTSRLKVVQQVGCKYQGA